MTSPEPLTREAYQRLIEDDLIALRSVLGACPERSHIEGVLQSSVDLIFPQKIISSGPYCHGCGSKANHKDIWTQGHQFFFCCGGNSCACRSTERGWRQERL